MLLLLEFSTRTPIIGTHFVIIASGVHTGLPIAAALNLCLPAPTEHHSIIHGMGYVLGWQFDWVGHGAESPLVRERFICDSTHLRRNIGRRFQSFATFWARLHIRYGFTTLARVILKPGRIAFIILYKYGIFRQIIRTHLRLSFLTRHGAIRKKLVVPMLPSFLR